jgi:hypothetical protein
MYSCRLGAIKGTIGMASREDLEQWVCEALEHHGGEAALLEVSKYVWAKHEYDLRASDNCSTLGNTTCGGRRQGYGKKAGSLLLIIIHMAFGR